MKTLLQSINTDQLLDIDYYIDSIQKLIPLLHTISRDPIAKIAVGIVLFITILKIILKYRRSRN